MRCGAVGGCCCRWYSASSRWSACRPIAKRWDTGDVAPGLGAFLIRYWQFHPWPGAHFTGADFGFTWNHLWYLAYLVPYSLLMIGLASLLRPLRALLPSGSLSNRVIATAGLLLPVSWLAWNILVVLPDHPPTHALIGDLFVIVLLYWLRPLALGPWLEPMLVLVGTFAGSLLLHELLIRRVPLLRPLFGLPRRHPARNPASPSAVNAPRTRPPAPYPPDPSAAG